MDHHRKRGGNSLESRKVGLLGMQQLSHKKLYRDQQTMADEANEAEGGVPC